jgi:hypothetical protein
MARNRVAENAAEVEEQESRLKIVKDRTINDLKQILETKEGRRWVFGLLEKCHVFHSVMTGNSYTFFNDGMRQVGLSIIEELGAVDPNMFGNMFAESFKWKEEVEQILTEGRQDNA